MHAEERQLVLDQLASSEARLVALTANLTPEQWNFRESPERWSIAENVEHVILFERFLTGVLEKILATPPAPEKQAAAATKESHVHNIADGRDTKFNAREVVRPTGQWADPVELLAELHSTRAQTIAWVTAAQDDFRAHFFPHVALGELDGYQWLVVMAQHGARHAHQIEDIQSHPAYPAA